MGHDTYSAGVLLVCAIHVPFCAVASFCMAITTLWCYSTVICARLFDTVIFSGFHVIYCLTAEGSNKWLFLLLSHGRSEGFEALGIALPLVVILDNQINIGVFVVTRMPPKREQNYTES